MMSPPIESPRSAVDDVEMYGYVDCGPPSFIAPRTAAGNSHHHSIQHSSHPPLLSRGCVPRRSSMKCSTATIDDEHTRHQQELHKQRRRATIGACYDNELVVEIHLHGKSKPETIRRRRSILFCEGVAVHTVQPVKSLTKSPETLWFQKEEFEQMRRDVWDTVDSIHSRRMSGSSRNGDPTTADGSGGSHHMSHHNENDDDDDDDDEDDDECWEDQENELNDCEPRQRYQPTRYHHHDDDAANDDPPLCARGLEKLLKPDETRSRRRLSLDSVLHEQHMQRQDGWYDDEQLATVYRCATIRSSKEASLRAQKDAQDAYRYYSSQASSTLAASTTLLSSWPSHRRCSM